MVDYLFDEEPRCHRNRYCSLSLGGGQSKSRQNQQTTSVGPLGGGQNYGDISNLLSGTIKGNAPMFGNVFDQPFQAIQPTALNSMGLYGGQQEAFGQAVSDALGKLSGNFTARGFNTPRVVSALAGSAAQNVLPQFAPLMGQQISTQDALRHQLSMAPEQVRQQRTLQLAQFIQALSGALGQNQVGFGSGTSSSWNAQGSAGQKTTP